MRLAVVCLGMVAAFAGCRSTEPTFNGPATELLLLARQGALDGPDSLSAGWTRFTVEEVAGNHIVVLFRVSATMSRTDLAAFVATLDTARATPTGVTALGGPEVDGAAVILGLPVGRYLIACMTRDQAEHRHATIGEVRFLEVVDGGSATSGDSAGTTRLEPTATQHVGMSDFAFTGPETWKAGPNVLRVTNDGKQDHLLRLVRLRPGVTTRDWLEAERPNRVSINITGLSRRSPQREAAYLPVDLEPGDYVLYCLIPDQASGKPHIELGMFRGVRVE